MMITLRDHLDKKERKLTVTFGVRSGGRITASTEPLVRRKPTTTYGLLNSKRRVYPNV